MGKFFIRQKKGLLLTDFYYRRYFSNIIVQEGFVLLTDNKQFYFSDSRYFLAVKEKLNGTNIVPVLFRTLKDIKDIIDKEKINSVGIDFEKTTLAQFKGYKKELKCDFFDCSNIIKEIRAVKKDSEIENIKIACQICEKSFYEALSFVKAGITEKELRDYLENRFIANGAEGVSFNTIVAFNENSAIPHHETSDKILTKNSVILIDCGCLYKGYCSDYTRTFFFGEPTAEFVKNYNAVWGANELAEKLITSNMNSGDADKIARDYLKTNNLDKFFTHSLGHGLGLEIHEYPTLSFSRKTMLKDNMVFTVEPGIYFDGKYGIRVEDTVVLKNGKIERLFTDSKDLIKLEIK